MTSRNLPVNYPDSVQFLYALGNEIKTAKLGLERIAQVLDALGRPQDRLRFVHVAGTNGKGSTCAMIESALRAAGGARDSSPRPTWPSPPSASGSMAGRFPPDASPPPSNACMPPWSNCWPMARSTCTPLTLKP